MDPIYYANHIRHAVRFSDGIQEITREIKPDFLEVGPDRPSSPWSNITPSKATIRQCCTPFPERLTSRVTAGQF